MSQPKRITKEEEGGGEKELFQAFNDVLVKTWERGMGCALRG